MKKSELLIVVVLIATSLAGTFFFMRARNHSHLILQNERLITAYNTEIIPLYQKKAELVQNFLKEINYQSTAIQGFLVHGPQWKAETLSDIQSIEELQSHLDTLLAQEIIMTKVQTQTMKQLESIDRQINETKPSIIPSQVASH